MLSEFETFLSKSRKVPENGIKFYIHWVQRFLTFCKYQLESINTEQVDKFLDSLEADNNIADWQVKQAADAVITYVELFLKKQLRSSDRSDSDNKTRKLSLAWGRAFEDTPRYYMFETLFSEHRKDVSRLDIPFHCSCEKP